MDPNQEAKYWRRQARLATLLSWLYGFQLVVLLLPVLFVIVVVLIILFG